MPADLDRIFDELRTEADAVPLSPPASARRRGTRRTRTHALTAAAVAVCLAGGVFSLAPSTPPTVPPATTTPPLPGFSIAYGAPARTAVSAVASGSVYTAWQGADGTVRYFESSLSEAGVSAVRVADVPGELDGAVVLGGKLVISTREDAGYQVRGLDPESGAVRWNFAVATPGDLALFERYVVFREQQTGLITGLDAGSGRTAWTAPSDPGPGTPMLAVGTSDLAPRAGSATLPPVLPRITDAGAPASYVVTVAGGKAVALSPDTGARSQVRFPAGPGTGRGLDAMIGCGQGRLCIADDVRVAAVGPATGAYIFQAQAPGKVTGLTWAGDALIATTEAGTAVFDLDEGTPVAVTPGPVVQGARSLFALPTDAGGPVTRIGGATLGSLPVPAGDCAGATDRLVCPGAESLQVFFLPRD